MRHGACSFRIPQSQTLHPRQKGTSSSSRHQKRQGQFLSMETYFAAYGIQRLYHPNWTRFQHIHDHTRWAEPRFSEPQFAEPNPGIRHLRCLINALRAGEKASIICKILGVLYRDPHFFAKTMSSTEPPRPKGAAGFKRWSGKGILSIIFFIFFLFLHIGSRLRRLKWASFILRKKKCLALRQGTRGKRKGEEFHS